MKYTPHKKIIPYQLVINLQKDIETLDSLEEYFHSLLDHFSLNENPGSQEDTGSYLVNQLILAELYQEYQILSKKFHQELRGLKNAPAIKPEVFLE